MPRIFIVSAAAASMQRQKQARTTAGLLGGSSTPGGIELSGHGEKATQGAAPAEPSI
jgi:hypothetical protein